MVSQPTLEEGCEHSVMFTRAYPKHALRILRSVTLNLPLSAGAPVLDVPWVDAIVADTEQGERRLNRSFQHLIFLFMPLGHSINQQPTVIAVDVASVDTILSSTVLPGGTRDNGTARAPPAAE